MNEQELREAYAVLDLPENATKEEVEKRYFLLLKKSKTGRQNNTGGTGQIDVDAVNRAYKTINQNELQMNVRKFEETHYAGSKSRQAIDNFWHRYKTHVLLSILGLVVIVVAINSYLDKRAENEALSKLPPANVEVLFVGEFYPAEGADLGQTLLTYFPEWQRIKAGVSYNPENPKDQFDIAAVQKNMLNLMTEKPDVYVTDRFNFELMVKQGVFQKLEETNAGFPAERLVKGQREEDDQLYVYGVDVSDSPVFKKLELAGKPEKIVAFRFDTDNTENNLRFVQTLLGID